MVAFRVTLAPTVAIIAVPVLGVGAGYLLGAAKARKVYGTVFGGVAGAFLGAALGCILMVVSMQPRLRGTDDLKMQQRREYRNLALRLGKHVEAAQAAAELAGALPEPATVTMRRASWHVASPWPRPTKADRGGPNEAHRKVRPAGGSPVAAGRGPRLPQSRAHEERLDLDALRNRADFQQVLDDLERAK